MTLVQIPANLKEPKEEGGDMIFKFKKRKYIDAKFPPEGIPPLVVQFNERYSVTYRVTWINAVPYTLATATMENFSKRTYKWTGKYWDFQGEYATEAKKLVP